VTKQSHVDEEIASAEEHRLATTLRMPLFASLSTRLLAWPCRKVLLRRERETGDGAPEGLPLICRFFLNPHPVLRTSLSPQGRGRGEGKISSISAMENPYPRQLIRSVIS
jgi:hypothetical protein